MRTAVNVGIVGLGRTGDDFATALASLPQAEVRWLCDQSAEVRLLRRRAFPQAQVTACVDDLLADESLDAVVITTPAATHHELARRALQAEKHVLVQGPLALRGVHADELVELADRYGRRLAVAHRLVFHPAVRLLKALLDGGQLGEIYYLSSQRHALDASGRAGSALWSLGAEELALIVYLLADQPITASVAGDSYVRPDAAEVAAAHLGFATGITAYLHLSALDPRTIHSVTVVGSQRVAVFDPIAPDRQLTVYEKRAEAHAADGVQDVQFRLGDVVSPQLPEADPLRMQCEDFVAAVRSRAHDLDGARRAAAVVSALETLERSLTNDHRASAHGPAVLQEGRVVRLSAAPGADPAGSRPITADSASRSGRRR